MELNETSDMMLSNDYQERFKVEYYQVKIRINKLKEFINKYENNELGFTPKTPLFIYKAQLEHMEDYFSILDLRQGLEEIDF